ncbi:4'-phosphopantetheinyl transferase family protein [Streptococcus mutans]|uniref:4'-phosphopantetheinyl transferase family protein n=1 Tax=Streptococcus mutans TaxID=1309 RepID=UPI0002B535B8|nr:hypothetical protein [Streptococcus mutans]EMB73064.1 4'-phosphopantetheinyl transferase [Streptococcus mutans 15VF2]EMP62498.1 4'-phosphopantetheinyl transferase [Streptococcus mutans KK23]QNT16296.1 4-phosphopantetheinyl transferase [Streptococcus mutans B04Sm5]
MMFIDNFRTKTLYLTLENDIYPICICVFKGNSVTAEMVGLLSSDDYIQYTNCISPKRKKQFLLGRLCAYKAINILTNFRESSVSIEKSFFNAPIIKGNGDISITISHSEDWVVAVAYSSKLMLGVDTESFSNNELIEKNISNIHQKVFNYITLYTNMNAYTLCWMVREALSKALRTGLTISEEVLQISETCVKYIDEYVILEFDFDYFPVFKGVYFELEGCPIALVFPKRLSFKIAIER